MGGSSSVLRCTCTRRRVHCACTSSVRRTGTCGGVHCAGSSSVLCCTCARRGVHCASTCSLCRACRDCNSWLRFSPCGAHRLQMMTLATSCARHVHSATIDVVLSANFHQI